MRATQWRWILASGAAVLAGCGAGGGTNGGSPDSIDFEQRDPATLTWVAPAMNEQVYAGDVLTFAVGAGAGTSHTVHFTVDGAEVGTCSSSADGESDCFEDDIYSWTVAISDAGTHTLGAWYADDGAARVEARRTVRVVLSGTGTSGGEPGSGPIDDPSSGGETDPLAPGGGGSMGIMNDPERTTPETGVNTLTPDETGPMPPMVMVDVATSMPRTRGYLDPNHGWRNWYNGREWAMRAQRVLLRSGTMQGDVVQVARCMGAYGDSIRRYADRFSISRASLAALAIAETNCTNPAPSATSTVSGPLRLRAATCSALNPGVSTMECLQRMHDAPDFAFDTAVLYLASPHLRALHRNDPPKIAVAYHVGGFRRSHADAWHVVAPHNYVTRFIQAYNAYRSWESLGMPPATGP